MPTPKTLKRSLIALLASGIMSILLPFSLVASAADPQPAGVGRDAILALGRMSKALAAKQFSFESHTFRTYAGPNGEALHIEHATKTVFRRPNRLSVDVTGDDGSTKMLYNGKDLVIYAVEQKKYAITPVAGGIDNALDVAENRTGMDLPLADLLADDPGQSLLVGVTTGGQVGTATIGGVRCCISFLCKLPKIWSGNFGLKTTRNHYRAA